MSPQMKGLDVGLPVLQIRNKIGYPMSRPHSPPTDLDELQVKLKAIRCELQEALNPAS